MNGLIHTELSKLRRDPLVIGTFLGMIGMPLFNVLVLLSRGGGYMREHGYTLLKLGDATLTIFSVIFLPLIVSLVVSQVFAGEFRGGTMRSLLSCPVDRWQVLIAKEFTVLLWTLALTGTGLLTLLALGVLLHVPPGGADAGPIAARLGPVGAVAATFLAAWCGLLGFTGFVTLLAVAARSVFVPLIGGMLAAIAGVIALNADAGYLYFGSVNTLVWKHLQESVPGVADMLLITVLYFVVFLALSLIQFGRMDVTD